MMSGMISIQKKCCAEEAACIGKGRGLMWKDQRDIYGFDERDTWAMESNTTTLFLIFVCISL